MRVALVSLALALTAAGCASPATRESAATVEGLQTITTDLGVLDTTFDAARARPRVLAILSPT